MPHTAATTPIGPRLHSWVWYRCGVCMRTAVGTPDRSAARKLVRLIGLGPRRLGTAPLFRLGASANYPVPRGGATRRSLKQRDPARLAGAVNRTGTGC